MKTYGIGVRRIIAVLLTTVFCVMTLKGSISSDQMIPIYTMVLGFYFGKATALEVPDKYVNKPDHLKETKE